VAKDAVVSQELAEKFTPRMDAVYAAKLANLPPKAA
jgi:hypothetical protein